MPIIQYNKKGRHVVFLVTFLLAIGSKCCSKEGVDKFRLGSEEIERRRNFMDMDAKLLLQNY